MRLTAIQLRRTCRSSSRTFRSRQPFNPNEEHMGSTSFGSVNPANPIGPTMPQNIEINRASPGRVRDDGRA